MEFKNWDFENDIVTVDRTPFFSSNEDIVSRYIRNVYAVNTEKGIFYQKLEDNGTLNLIFVDHTGAYLCMEDIEVIGADLNNTAMIVHVRESGENYLVDTRGIFYLLDVNKSEVLSEWYSFKLNRKTGFYQVGNRTTDRWLLRGISKKEIFNLMIKSAPKDTAGISNDFNKFLKKKSGKW